MSEHVALYKYTLRETFNFLTQRIPFDIPDKKILDKENSYPAHDFVVQFLEKSISTLSLEELLSLITTEANLVAVIESHQTLSASFRNLVHAKVEGRKRPLFVGIQKDFKQGDLAVERIKIYTEFQTMLQETYTPQPLEMRK